MKNKIPIRIEAKASGKRGPIPGYNVQIYDPETGESIGSARKVDIRMRLEEVVTAKIEFMPDEIDIVAMVDRAALRIKKAELQHKIILIDEMLRQ